MQTERWKIAGVGHYQFKAPRTLMPKIRDAVIDATFYLFRLNPKTGAIDGPCGTGFFVLRPSDLPAAHPHIYAVTNWHVARDAGASIIRVNTSNGSSRFIEYDPSEWHCPQNGDDIAAIDITKDIDPGADQMIGLYEDMFVMPEIINSFSMGVGEDTFMCGLFASHDGGDRNVPVIRFGNLSMMASDTAPVELESGARLPCHLVDTRSRTGFSGSPVFVYRTQGSDLTWLPYGWVREWSPAMNEVSPTDTTHKQQTRPESFWGLLGIHCGQFWDPVQFRKIRSKERLGDPIAEGDELEIQSGMTIVIPSWRITALLDCEEFDMARKQRDDEGFTASQRRPRAEVVGGPLSNDDNLTHREDFTRLVNAAARKPVRED